MTVLTGCKAARGQPDKREEIGYWFFSLQDSCLPSEAPPTLTVSCSAALAIISVSSKTQSLAVIQLGFPGLAWPGPAASFLPHLGSDEVCSGVPRGQGQANSEPDPGV